MKSVKFLSWETIEKKTRWIFEKFPSEKILSSRVRLARNIEGFPFPHNMSFREGEKVENLILKKLIEYQTDEMFVIRVDKISQIEKDFLVERHIISKEFTENHLPSTVVIFPEEKVSIMINEEDHIRIQSIQPGNNLRKAFRMVNKIDDFLDEKLNYAFSKELGYLTACPTNIGTGLRASFLLHLPALSLSGNIKRVFSAIEEIGIMVRGFYGEGTIPAGNIFQISTRETTGKEEKEIIEEIESVVKLIIEEEKKAVEMLKKNEKLKKKIYRKLKEIKEIESISSEEFFPIFSLVSLAEEMGIISINRRVLKNLFIETLPAHMQFKKKMVLSPVERDYERGKIIKRKVRSLNV